MKIKNVLEMDYYELLNVDQNASVQEIERAYELSKMTYRTDSIAHYSLVSEEERQRILDRIERAFATLKDPETRRSYDFKVIGNESDNRKRAFFRKTTEKMLFEDTADKPNIWRKIKYFFFSPPKKR